jgi:hypothetical protein
MHWKCRAGSPDPAFLAETRRHPVALPSDSAPAELLRALEGRYRTEAGEGYTLSLRQGRLSLAYCTYPPALVVVQADGSFTCPMLWGTKGKLRREPGQPVSALLLSQFGQESIAKRLAGDAGGGYVRGALSWIHAVECNRM